jgi:hypothetical protein
MRHYRASQAQEAAPAQARHDARTRQTVRAKAAVGVLTNQAAAQAWQHQLRQQQQQRQGPRTQLGGALRVGVVGAAGDASGAGARVSLLLASLLLVHLQVQQQQQLHLRKDSPSGSRGQGSG